jgi:hypothetical protein
MLPAKSNRSSEQLHHNKSIGHHNKIKKAILNLNKLFKSPNGLHPRKNLSRLVQLHINYK